MNPRFPPRGTPEYWEFIEHWLLVERVDNERQWKLLRQAEGIVSGLNPIQSVVSLTFPAPHGSGSGSPGCGTCSNIFVKFQYSPGDSTWSLTGGGAGSPCSWQDITGTVSLNQTGDVVRVTYCGQTWERSASTSGNACTVGGGFSLVSNTGGCLVPVSISITFVVP